MHRSNGYGPLHSTVGPALFVKRERSMAGGKEHRRREIGEMGLGIYAIGLAVDAVGFVEDERHASAEAELL